MNTWCFSLSNYCIFLFLPLHFPTIKCLRWSSQCADLWSKLNTRFCRDWDSVIWCDVVAQLGCTKYWEEVILCLANGPFSLYLWDHGKNRWRCESDKANTYKTCPENLRRQRSFERGRESTSQMSMLPQLTQGYGLWVSIMTESLIRIPRKREMAYECLISGFLGLANSQDPEKLEQQ